MDSFRTHTGEIVTGDRLSAAFKKVAADIRENAHARRAEGQYAEPVTDEQKDRVLGGTLALADRIESGMVTSFAAWEDLNAALTGEFVPIDRLVYAD